MMCSKNTDRPSLYRFSPAHSQAQRFSPAIALRTLLFTHSPHTPNAHVVPSAHLCLHLHDRFAAAYICYWLGVPLHSNTYTYLECHEPADPLGDDQVGCVGNRDRIACHNAIRDVLLLNAAQSAALAPTKEASSLVPGSSTCLAKLNILLPYWGCGCPAALDVSVIPPLQQLTMVEAPGYALKVGVWRKLTSNLPACRSASVNFLPIVVETLEGWCPDAITTIRSTDLTYIRQTSI